MMNLDSAIASFFSFFEKHEPLGRGINDTPIFFLGDARDLAEAQESMFGEIQEALRDRTPCPFERQLLFSVMDGKWQVCVVVRANEGEDERKIYVLSWFYGSDNSWHRLFAEERAIRYEVATGKEAPVPASINFAAYAMAFISHPANYVVKETPLLTSKEARRIEHGKRYPDAKRPRYVIVDHEVLVNRLKPQGTHTSPIPHHRRGHWMRLAEQCKHARARGIEKVWVRDCNVGETDFVVNNRRYQVLLNFHEGQRA